MTVETELMYVIYEGDNIAVTFPFTFPVYHEDHLIVYLRDFDSQNLLLLDASDYSVTGIGDENGGSVVTNDAVSNENEIIIARILPITQDLDVLNQGGFYPQNVEEEFDFLTMMVQQVDDEVNRSVRGHLTETWPEVGPPILRRAKLLGFTDDEFAYPTVDVIEILVGLLGQILVAGPGIGITIGTTTITITNLWPQLGGGGAEQECWLLEDTLDGIPPDQTELAEFIRDTIAAALVGVGVTITDDDATDQIILEVTGDGGGVSAEEVFDAIASAITAGTGITVTDDDVANTTTIAADPEFIRDTIGTAIVGGVGIEAAVSDGSDTITINTKPDILTVASSASVTPTFAVNQVNITAQATGLTLANPTGTAVDGHGILIRITDNGTSRSISYGTKYRQFSDTLPTATTANKTIYLGIVYNDADDKWDVLGVRQEA